MIEGRIVQYITRESKRARRNQPALPAGSRLWLIEYHPGRYFYCGYELKVSAAKVKDRLEGTQREIDFNSVTDPDRVMHYMGEVKA